MTSPAEAANGRFPPLQNLSRSRSEGPLPAHSVDELAGPATVICIQALNVVSVEKLSGERIRSLLIYFPLARARAAELAKRDPPHPGRGKRSARLRPSPLFIAFMSASPSGRGRQGHSAFAAAPRDPGARFAVDLVERIADAQTLE